MFNFCYHMYILSTEYFYSYSAKKKNHRSKYMTSSLRNYTVKRKENRNNNHIFNSKVTYYLLSIKRTIYIFDNFYELFVNNFKLKYYLSLKH